MATSRFLVLERSFIFNRLVEPGTLVDIDFAEVKDSTGPGSNLAPCDEDGNLLEVKELSAKEQEALAKQIEQNAIRAANALPKVPRPVPPATAATAVEPAKPKVLGAADDLA